MKNFIIGLVILILAIGVLFRVFCGIFVIQPIGAIPEGTSIVYWRNGLNMPFIASADGLLLEAGNDVTLLGRGIMMAGLTDVLLEREVFRFPYSEALYLRSTGGVLFEK